MVGGLRDQAIIDLKQTVQSEFGQNIRLATDQKDSEFKVFIGNSNDIHTAIDAETNQIVTGRSAHAVLILKEVLDFFGELPKKKWRVQFIDISPGEFAVKEVRPDASLGILVLILVGSISQMKCP